MLMTESSLSELNKKLKNPVKSLQFRPNIVVSGTEPFIEDNWEWIKIGKNVIIRNVKPCPRFVLFYHRLFCHKIYLKRLRRTDVL